MITISMIWLNVIQWIQTYKTYLLSLPGTVCDAGVFAPVLSFQKLFEAEGVPITDAETRAPMGVHKRVRYDWSLVRKW